jgi:hypothetical protein
VFLRKLSVSDADQGVGSHNWFFVFVVKGPAADPTDASQLWGLLSKTCDEDFFPQFLQVKEHRWNEIYKGKPKYSGGKTCPSASFFHPESHMDLPGIEPRPTRWKAGD